MPIKKNKKDKSEAEHFEPVFSADLLNRIRNIVEQTGISPPDLFLKWALQEESWIGLNKAGKRRQVNQQSKAVGKPAQKTKTGKNVASPGNKKELVRKATMLVKNGMTHAKIAQTFNEQNVPTVSGTGKWYASSITNLLKAKK